MIMMEGDKTAEDTTIAISLTATTKATITIHLHISVNGRGTRHQEHEVIITHHLRKIVGESQVGVETRGTVLRRRHWTTTTMSHDVIVNTIVSEKLCRLQQSPLGSRPSAISTGGGL